MEKSLFMRLTLRCPSVRAKSLKHAKNSQKPFSHSKFSRYFNRHLNRCLNYLHWNLGHTASRFLRSAKRRAFFTYVSPFWYFYRNFWWWSLGKESSQRAWPKLTRNTFAHESPVGLMIHVVVCGIDNLR